MGLLETRRIGSITRAQGWTSKASVSQRRTLVVEKRGAQVDASIPSSLYVISTHCGEVCFTTGSLLLPTLIRDQGSVHSERERDHECPACAR